MKRRVFALGLAVLLAAALLMPFPAGAQQFQVIQLNQEYQGSFSKGGETVFYYLTVPQDGLIKLDGQTDGRMDAAMHLATSDSGATCQEARRISGTGYSTNSRLKNQISAARLNDLILIAQQYGYNDQQQKDYYPQ